MSDSTMDGCVFCRIVAGEVPSRQVYSSPMVYAFHDLHPAASVHVLIVPREHVADAGAVGSAHGPMLAELLMAAHRVAETEGVAQSGYRLVFNVGQDAGAEVPHLHLHVLGGRKFSWPPG